MLAKSGAVTDARPVLSYRPRDMRWDPDAPCLSVSSVSASSDSGKANGAKNTLDRDMRTRWSPAKAGAQWLLYDLGSAKTVSGASVVWYALMPTTAAFTIEVSTDGKSFTKVDDGTFGGRGTNTTLRTFLAMQGRYVRVGINAPSIAACPGIYEVGIHGEGA